MEITKNKVVSLTYELRLNGSENEVIESVGINNPLTFIFGSGHLLQEFEKNLAGLKTGDTFDFNLASEDAYGNFDPASVIEIPITAFHIDGKVDHELVKPGNTVPMQDSEGNRLNGVVKSITDDKVSMDFNHPLAGNSLFFKGEVTDVREATEEELHHGHVHGKSNCSDCSTCGDEGCCG